VETTNRLLSEFAYRNTSLARDERFMDFSCVSVWGNSWLLGVPGGQSDRAIRSDKARNPNWFPTACRTVCPSGGGGACRRHRCWELAAHPPTGQDFKGNPRHRLEGYVRCGGRTLHGALPLALRGSRRNRFLARLILSARSTKSWPPPPARSRRWGTRCPGGTV